MLILPENPHLSDVIKAIESLRGDCLFEMENTSGMTPMAQNHFVKGMAFLELAKLEIESADMWEARENPRRGP